MPTDTTKRGPSAPTPDPRKHKATDPVRVRPDEPNGQTVMQAALAAAALGYRVHPLRPGTKLPILTAWQVRASADAEQVATWFGEHPDAGLAIATGGGLLVVDVDGEAGRASLAELEAEHGPLRGHRVHTPSGGLHLYLRVPDGVRTRTNAGQIAPGIDLRGDGGYVVARPTVLADGRRYRAKKPLPRLGALRKAPAWLREVARRPEPVVASAAPSRAWADLDADDRAHIERSRASALGPLTVRLDALSAAATPDGQGYTGEAWNDTVHAVACELVRWARLPSLNPTDELARMRAVLTLHAPRDAGFGEAQHDQVWRSAVREVTEAGQVAQLPPALLDVPAPATVGADEQRRRLDAAHDTFRRWLGEGYDLDAIDATLAAAAVEKLEGDPLWLMIISGSGAAKTETVQALAGSGALVVSSISSAGALLSATSRRERTTSATGGLLRKIGPRGVLVVKDFTSVISMHREARDEVMAALREVYDGKWVRVVGTDGGQELPWEGRLVIVGACTTAWDSASAVLGAMGDRFGLLRIDSTIDRRAASRQAIANRGHEDVMRAELQGAAHVVLEGITAGDGFEPTKAEREALEAVADLVTLARTAVERDYRGDVVNAHAPEMGTRFGKQLAQVLRGGVAIGLDRTDALALALRVARDSIPPGRLGPLLDVAAHPNASTQEIRRRLDKPYASVDRELQALHILNVVTVTEEPTLVAGREGTRWRYALAEGLADALAYLSPVPDVSVHPHENTKEGRQYLPPDVSGTARKVCLVCGDALIAPRNRSAGLCAKQDADHQAARLLDSLDLVPPAPYRKDA